MKTPGEIKNDIYAALKTSALVQEITGELRKGKRPVNSNKEDICINVVSNDDFGRVQDATAYVNVYVPTIMENGQHVENTKRTRKLEKLADTALHCVNGGDYRFTLQSQLTEEVEAAQAYVIQNKLNFEQNND